MLGRLGVHPMTGGRRQCSVKRRICDFPSPIAADACCDPGAPCGGGLRRRSFLRRGVRPVRHHRRTAAVTVVLVIPVVLSSVFFLHLFLHPFSPSFRRSFHPSLPPLCFPALASLAVDMVVFSTCCGCCCCCCLPLLLSFLQLLLRLLMQPLLRPASVQRIAFENATFCVQLTFVD